MPSRGLPSPPAPHTAMATLTSFTDPFPSHPAKGCHPLLPLTPPWLPHDPFPSCPAKGCPACPLTLPWLPHNPLPSHPARGCSVSPLMLPWHPHEPHNPHTQPRAALPVPSCHHGSFITLFPHTQAQGLPSPSPHTAMAPSPPSFLAARFLFLLLPPSWQRPLLITRRAEGGVQDPVNSKSNKNKALMGSHGTLWHLHLRDTGQQGQCSWWTKGVGVASLHSNELFNHSLNEVSNRDITRQLHHSNADYLKHVC